MNKNVYKIQKRLLELGFNPGKPDGVRGRRTIRAVKEFQASKGLKVDGMVGRNTLAALFDDRDQQHRPSMKSIGNGDETPWMDEATRVMGLHERRDHRSLWNWLRMDGATVGDPAKIPWCGDFVQTAIALSMPDEPIPENPYLAANWTKFGFEVEPQWGAVLVFWRGSPSSWKGHVGFYAGETNSHFLVRGGNQQNRVSDVLIAKSRIRRGGVRWPETAMAPPGRKIIVDGRGRPITTNEA